MTNFFEALGNFTSGHTVWVMLFIFFGKVIEVSLATLRIVLINRGERIVGAIIAFIEVLLWLVIASSVLNDYQSAPLKMFIYAGAFGVGNFMGSWLEERLAFGLCSIQTVVMDAETSALISESLRKQGFGVTELEVQGRDGDPRFMLMQVVKRRLVNESTTIIQKLYPNAVITISDVKSLKGGYMRGAQGRKLRK